MLWVIAAPPGSTGGGEQDVSDDPWDSASQQQSYPPGPPPYGQSYPPGPPPYLDPRQPGGYAHAPTVAPEPPKSIVWACRLMLVRVAMSVIGLVILVATRNSIRGRIESIERSRGVNLSQATLDRLATLGLISGIVGSAISVVLFLVLVVYVRRGRQWARIVTWIFAGLGTAGVVLSITGTQGATPVSRLVGGLGSLLDIAVIVLLARGSSSRYVRESGYWRDWHRAR